MVGLHGLAGVCAAAVHGAPIVMGTQLHTAVCRHALGVVGTDRSAGAVKILWDSIRAIQGDWRAQYRLVAWIRAYQDMILRDSIGALCQGYNNLT